MGGGRGGGRGRKEEKEKGGGGNTQGHAGKLTARQTSLNQYALCASLGHSHTQSSKRKLITAFLPTGLRGSG